MNPSTSIPGNEVNVLRISRDRMKELLDANETWVAPKLGFTATMTGPKNTVLKFSEVGAPTTFAVDYTDTSEWVHVTVLVEPEWETRRTPFGTWVAGQQHLIDKFGTGHLHGWKTETLAQQYLDLLKEDWWTDYS